jgi:hypothetical protein
LQEDEGISAVQLEAQDSLHEQVILKLAVL